MILTIDENVWVPQVSSAAADETWDSTNFNPPRNRVPDLRPVLVLWRSGDRRVPHPCGFFCRKGGIA
jgi:hypothetical protein